jgi:glycosyltransferase involved in cell wall biosynthesis
VYLGRSVVSKGLTDLAAACELGGLDDVEVHLYCALDESSPGALTPADLARLDRPPTVTVHPPTSHPAAVIGAAHASILPSRAGEGVSKFVLESLACGTPVLLSEASGSGEVIAPGETGVVFKAADPVSINAALREVAGWSASRRAEARVACRSVAQREYSLEVILPRIVRLHRDALDEGRS